MPKETSKPFPPETTELDPVQESVLAARRAYEQARRDARAKWEGEAAASFDQHEAKRRQNIIAEWKLDNPFKRPQYQYEDWEPAAIYRDSLPYDERVPRLLEEGLYDQALRCFLVRHNPQATATIEEIKSFLKPYMPVDGNFSIVPNDHERADLIRHGRANVHSHADGLSSELADLLEGSMIEVWLGTVKFDWRHDHPERDSW